MVRVKALAGGLLFVFFLALPSLVGMRSFALFGLQKPGASKVKIGASSVFHSQQARLPNRVVFDMPIFSNAPVGDAVDVSGDEIDGLTLTSDLPKASREVTVKPQVRDNTITRYDYLLNLAVQPENQTVASLDTR